MKWWVLRIAGLLCAFLFGCLISYAIDLFLRLRRIVKDLEELRRDGRHIQAQAAAIQTLLRGLRSQIQDTEKELLQPPKEWLQ